jgi:hypothetical protein
MIKKLLFSFLVLFSLSNLANAQAVVVTESFDNNPFVPTGWALKPATPQPLWVRSTTSTFPTVTPHSGNAMARFRSRSAIAGLTQQLVTKAIDYSNRGNTATSVSFWIYRDDINANFDSITVYVNNTDSMDANAVLLGSVARNRTYMIPDIQAVNGWYNYSFSIPKDVLSQSIIGIVVFIESFFLLFILDIRLLMKESMLGGDSDIIGCLSSIFNVVIHCDVKI